MRIALVIPTIREEQIRQFLLAWHEQLVEAEVTTFIVEDNDTKTLNLPLDQLKGFDGRAPVIRHMSLEDAPPGMIETITIRSPSCRQLGYWKAYHEGFDVILTLDDDVRPAEGPNLFLAYRDILVNGVPRWVDPLLNYRSRGYPVKNTGSFSVAFHVGSFLTIPDVDGDTQLAHQLDFPANPPRYIPRPTVVPLGQYLPVNGGICGWRREMTPFIHYTVWDDVLNFRRFDDIWMGIMLKKILDHCGLHLSYGGTFVNHIRASVAEKNQKLEQEGKKWNETFWEDFDKRADAALKGVAREPKAAFRAVAQALGDMDNRWAQREATAMLTWNKFFE